MWTYTNPEPISKEAWVVSKTIDNKFEVSGDRFVTIPKLIRNKDYLNLLYQTPTGICSWTCRRIRPWMSRLWSRLLVFRVVMAFGLSMWFSRLFWPLGSLILKNLLISGQPSNHQQTVELRTHFKLHVNILIRYLINLYKKNLIQRIIDYVLFIYTHIIIFNSNIFKIKYLIFFTCVKLDMKNSIIKINFDDIIYF